jgi:hypothetical protein
MRGVLCPQFLNPAPVAHRAFFFQTLFFRFYALNLSIASPMNSEPTAFLQCKMVTAVERRISHAQDEE